jgi:hypothetical protein
MTLSIMSYTRHSTLNGTWQNGTNHNIVVAILSVVELGVAMVNVVAPFQGGGIHKTSYNHLKYILKTGVS